MCKWKALLIEGKRKGSAEENKMAKWYEAEGIYSYLSNSVFSDCLCPLFFFLLLAALTDKIGESKLQDKAS